MPSLKCGPCGAVVSCVGVCRTCHAYLCVDCTLDVGCCGRKPAEQSLSVVEGPLLTPEDDDEDPDSTDLEYAGQGRHTTDEANLAEIDRWLDDGGAVPPREGFIAGEDYEIGGEG